MQKTQRNRTGWRLSLGADLDRTYGDRRGGLPTATQGRQGPSGPWTRWVASWGRLRTLYKKALKVNDYR